MNLPGSGDAVFREVSVGRFADLQSRGRMVVEIDGAGIGVFCVGSQVRAYRNVCPHAGGPVCQGKMMPRTLETVSATGQSLGLAFSHAEQHIVCPWHGYEFDVMTGHHPVDPRVRLTSVPVRIADGEVWVTVMDGGQEKQNDFRDWSPT
jgi:nitrite reductase/ring-hydroxylating ferredoxin subunit